ncbi:MAG: DLW-39 family protein [Actinomycetota bacterium]|nr:DLW-39 family protein [Actinomycetota bacterium]
MRKFLLLGALAGGAYAMVNKRKKTAAAEAKLWDEATGRTAAATPAPNTASVAGSNGAVK